jgi:hypothetical protein
MATLPLRAVVTATFIPHSPDVATIFGAFAAVFS